MALNANKWIGFGLRLIPYVGTIVNAVEEIKDAKGSAKLAKVKEAVEVGLPAIESVVDRDLLKDEKVSEAFDGFVSSYVNFQNALAAAKASKVKAEVPG